METTGEALKKRFCQLPVLGRFVANPSPGRVRIVIGIMYLSWKVASKPPNIHYKAHSCPFWVCALRNFPVASLEHQQSNHRPRKDIFHDARDDTNWLSGRGLSNEAFSNDALRPFAGKVQDTSFAQRIPTQSQTMNRWIGPWK